MRYTKKNLLLRRNGDKELTFVDLYESLSEKEIKRLKHDALAADALRNGAFYIKRKNLIHLEFSSFPVGLSTPAFIITDKEYFGKSFLNILKRKKGVP
jgi:hypothetical protein